MVRGGKKKSPRGKNEGGRCCSCKEKKLTVEGGKTQNNKREEKRGGKKGIICEAMEYSSKEREESGYSGERMGKTHLNVKRELTI